MNATHTTPSVQLSDPPLVVTLKHEFQELALRHLELQERLQRCPNDWLAREEIRRNETRKGEIAMAVFHADA